MYFDMSVIFMYFDIEIKIRSVRFMYFDIEIRSVIFMYFDEIRSVRFM